MKVYTQEQEQKIVELKKNFTTNFDIVKITGISLSTVKRIIKNNNLLLTPKQRQKNAYKARIAKNPNALAEMRSKITKEGRRKQTEGLIRSTIKRSETGEISKHFKRVWKKIKSNPNYKENIKKRNKTLSEVKLGFTHEEFEKRLMALKTDIENNLGTVSTLADKHGLNLVTALRAFHKRNWSSLINQYTSQGELEVYNFVLSLLKENEVLKNVRGVIGGLELDIYVPKHRFAIEYNGLFWHSEASGRYLNGYHVQKKKACEKNNIKLLSIYEDEWKDENKRNLIKSMIKFRLNAFSGKKIRASKLNVIKLEKNNQFKDFFDRNHLDGHVKSSYAIALVDNKSKIYSCMSIRKNFNGENEIARFATDYDYHVYGAASRLVKHLPKPIISYSNNRLSDGDVYKKLGFKEITKTDKPSYWYTDGKVRIWRFRCKRLNIKPALSKFSTEKEQALNGVFSKKIFNDYRPLYRIEDYGHKKWIFFK
ncbi:MAG: hypothetical protein EBU90_14635 [Proteobacteria bacterium]|nr:hypothetical protein [Pseudomonadota bacterium]NBP15689.1 hypothetical protein [bacterium]